MFSRICATMLQLQLLLLLRGQPGRKCQIHPTSRVHPQVPHPRQLSGESIQPHTLTYPLPSPPFPHPGAGKTPSRARASAPRQRHLPRGGSAADREQRRPRWVSSDSVLQRSRSASPSPPSFLDPTRWPVSSASGAARVAACMPIWHANVQTMWRELGPPGYLLAGWPALAIVVRQGVQYADFP